MVFTQWTQEEISQYLQIRTRELGSLYASAKISVNNPQKRAEYLAKILELSPTDQEGITRIASSKGKPEALRNLETLAINYFF